MQTCDRGDLSNILDFTHNRIEKMDQNQCFHSKKVLVDDNYTIKIGSLPDYCNPKAWIRFS